MGKLQINKDRNTSWKPIDPITNLVQKLIQASNLTFLCSFNYP